MNAYFVKCFPLFKKQPLEVFYSQHSCFPVNITKFLRTTILKNICKRMLLIILQRLLQNTPFDTGYIRNLARGLESSSRDNNYPKYKLERLDLKKQHQHPRNSHNNSSYLFVTYNFTVDCGMVATMKLKELLTITCWAGSF